MLCLGVVNPVSRDGRPFHHGLVWELSQWEGVIQRQTDRENAILSVHTNIQLYDVLHVMNKT